MKLSEFSFAFIRDRRRYFAFAVCVALSFFVFFQFISSRYLFAFTREGHYCLPYSLWVIHKQEKPKKGDYIAFVSKGVPFFSDGVKWVKILAGTSGDMISVTQTDIKDRYIDYNGVQKRMRIAGVVSLWRNGIPELTLEAYAYDTKDRGLPLIQPQVIQNGQYFVYSPSERSFDSRYWGLVSNDQIIGKAYPIL